MVKRWIQVSLQAHVFLCVRTLFIFLKRPLIFLAETTEGIKNKILESPAIEAVSQVQSQWIGPTAFAYKAEVDFDGTYLSAKLQSSYRKLFVDAAQKGDLSHELPILLS